MGSARSQGLVYVHICKRLYVFRKKKTSAVHQIPIQSNWQRTILGNNNTSTRQNQMQEKEKTNMFT